MKLAARPEARFPKRPPVPEGAPLDGESHVDGLVHQDAVEILRVDLEVGGRELDARAPKRSAAAFDDCTARAPQAPIPANRHRRPDFQGDGLGDGLEGSAAGLIQIERGNHETEPSARGGRRFACPLRTIPPMQAPFPRRLWTLGVLVLAAGVLGCGSENGASTGRDDFRSVYQQAMDAVGARDLQALWPLLTENGRQGVERELRQWQAMLAGGEGSELLRQRLRERLPEVTDAQVAQVARGSLADAWRFFLTADPHPARPKPAGLEIAPNGRSVRMHYLGPNGTMREVRLVQRPSGWYVDLLQL